MRTMNNTYEKLTIKNIGSWSASVVMIFGGVLPYVPQYKEIKQKEDAEGFSLYVCLALLIANTLRILFWFGNHYETPLLLQSVFMIVTMFVMIRLCITVRNRNQLIKVRERVLTDFDSKFFWKWTNFQSYLGFMVLFAVTGTLLMYLFIELPIFVETVGMVALLAEAILGVPQFLRNFYSKSTTGMSMAMVGLWMLGDLFKTCYFVIREAPIQFKICGALQVTIDIAILAQVYIYQSMGTAHSRIPARVD